MAKLNTIDKLVAQIDSEIETLQAMRARLVASRSPKPARKPRAVDVPARKETA